MLTKIGISAFSGRKRAGLGLGLLGVPAALAITFAPALAGVGAAGAQAATTTTTAATSTTVQPAASSNPCAGKSQATIVRTYYHQVSYIPLRCGTATWGYNHLVASHDYDPSMIQLTLAQGVQTSPGVYQYTVPQCPPLVYRVVYNGGALNGNSNIAPQGIITAYEVTPSAAVKSAASPRC
jgi:hypothetical protein